MSQAVFPSSSVVPESPSQGLLSLPGWIEKLLRQLAERPGSLLLAMLALNALFLPYRGLYHDALLYGLQVNNQVEQGQFAGDLFLRYGSQDSYSLFSRAVAPLAGLLGLQATFLLLYLAGMALFFWGVLRLVFALLPDRLLATLGLLAVAVSAPAIGGLGVFHVNESFLTPRLLASVLVVFGLERLLAGRSFLALILLFASLLLHPLMGFGGVLLFLLWHLFRHVGRPWLIGLAGVATAGILLLVLVPALGYPVFGYMNPAWKAEVRRALPCLLGTQWEVGDWLGVLVGQGVVVLAWWCWPGSVPGRTFVLALAVVTFLGIVGTVLVCYLPYALLLQGQPFRVLWLAQTLEVPLALVLARQAWPHPWRRILAVLLLGYLAGMSMDAYSVRVALVLALLLVVLLRFRWRADWSRGAWLSLAGGMAGAMLWATLGSWVVLITYWNQLTSITDVDECLRAFPALLALGWRLLLGLVVILGIAQGVGYNRAFRGVTLTLFLGLSLLGALVHEVPFFRKRLCLYSRDVRFLRAAIEAHPSGQPATVYWPINRVEHLWFDLKVQSYFSISQLVGNVFSAATAREGRRRANLVAAFELDQPPYRKNFLPAWQWRRLKNLFGAEPGSKPPGQEDLLRLCGEEDLDFVVIRQEFPGWYKATNGTWYVYDCQTLRSRPELASRSGSASSLNLKQSNPR
jgi:hypothetical protein